MVVVMRTVMMVVRQWNVSKGEMRLFEVMHEIGKTLVMFYGGARQNLAEHSASVRRCHLQVDPKVDVDNPA